MGQERGEEEAGRKERESSPPHTSHRPLIPALAPLHLATPGTARACCTARSGSPRLIYVRPLVGELYQRGLTNKSLMSNLLLTYGRSLSYKRSHERAPWTIWFSKIVDSLAFFAGLQGPRCASEDPPRPGPVKDGQAHCTDSLMAGRPVSNILRARQ